MKRYVVLMAVMALLVVSLAVPAFAGEQALGRANSICAASGQNDEPDAEFPRTAGRSPTGSSSRRARRRRG